ncbi:MAG: SIS domain-containing protein [Microbacterium sp.]
MIGYIPYATARSTQAAQLGAAAERIGALVEEWRADGSLSGPGPLFVGIGASLAAACAPVWSLRRRGIDAWRLSAGDFPLPLPHSAHPVIGISQSGRSTETLAALDSVARDLRFAVVNSVPSPVSEAAARTLGLGSIPDSYASTIGFTATVVALGMIADAWDDGEIDPAWHALPDQVATVDAELAARAGELAECFEDAVWADFIGSGPSVGSAEAGALLFREVARIPSSSLSTRTYLHGSMESASSTGVHVLFGSDREIDVARMLRAAGNRVILVTGDDVDDLDGFVVIRLPKVPPGPRAVLEAVAMQSLVQAVAHARSIDIEEFVFFHDDTKVQSSEETR